jgi:hypothetical protein
MTADESEKAIEEKTMKYKYQREEQSIDLMI